MDRNGNRYGASAQAEARRNRWSYGVLFGLTVTGTIIGVLVLDTLDSVLLGREVSL